MSKCNWKTIDRSYTNVLEHLNEILNWFEKGDAEELRIENKETKEVQTFNAQKIKQIIFYLELLKIVE